MRQNAPREVAGLTPGPGYVSVFASPHLAHLRQMKTTGRCVHIESCLFPSLNPDDSLPDDTHWKCPAIGLVSPKLGLWGLES